jgi:hypothetical protein
MSIVCYENDKGFVLSRFLDGEFEYVDAANEIMETDFFRFIKAKGYLQSMAETYPTPRKKEEVPLWFYLSSNLSMRLHGVHSFHSYPYIVRSGGMLQAFGPKVSKKTSHPQTGDVTLACEGFNEKNSYDRQTPADQDYLRKLSKDTDVKELERWFNVDLNRLWHKHKLFDPRGRFVGDATYVFVPDNDDYENSARLLFDENDHPVNSKELDSLSPQAAQKLRWRRCYKLVSLLYVDPERSYSLRVAIRLASGNAHECPLLYELVDEFVAEAGGGIIKRLLLDRGFLDGECIGKLKREYGIDVLIPVKRNMDVYADVMGLVSQGLVEFMPYKKKSRPRIEPPRVEQAPPDVQKRERKRQETIRAKRAAKAEAASTLPPDEVIIRSECGVVDNTKSFSSCPVPLNVIVNRDIYADGHEKVWMLLDTMPLSKKEQALERREEYSVRTDIEEGHRQLKCFWDLADFSSRAFSLVLNQIVFVLLTANLLQIFLHKQAKKRPEFPRRTRTRALELLTPTASVIVIYCDNRFAIFTPLEYTEILLTLSEAARIKILEKTRQLRRNLAEQLCLARPP